MKNIVFQGDSITDCGRSREDESNTGIGYATLVKAALGYEYPGEFTFYNRGVSGNRITDMYARIKKDAINLKPDIMSVLIGVNDVWHEYSFSGNNGVDAEKYFKIYCMFIEEVMEAVPNTKIMILEPFVLKGISTERCWDIFYAEVKKRAEKAEAIAKKYGLAFVPLQDKFEEAVNKAPEDYWLKDGVHPTAAGHELIKREWLRVFSELQRGDNYIEGYWDRY